MPARTVEQIQGTHSQYLDATDADDAAKFRDALNEVMPRLYKMGYWRDTLFEHSQEASDGYISLPPNADSIVAAIIDNSAVPTRSMWHDYKLFGTNDQDTTILSSFIDDGYSPTYRDILTTTDAQYQIKLLSIQPNNYLPNGSDIDIVIRHSTADLPDGYIEETMALNTASIASKESSEAEMNKIHQIAYNNIPAGYGIQIIAVDQVGTPLTDVILGEVPAGSGIVRYRRFRIGGTNSSSTAHVLLKRRWEDAVDSSETVYIPSRSMLKHALLGKLSEDNADVQRAEYHWGVAAKLLEEDMDSYRGAAKPVLQISPNGAGGAVGGMY